MKAVNRKRFDFSKTKKIFAHLHVSLFEYKLVRYDRDWISETLPVFAIFLLKSTLIIFIKPYNRTLCIYVFCYRD